MTTDLRDDAVSRLNSGILDLRVMLLDGRLRGERRRAIEAELEALRLLRVGVRAPGVVAYAARHGVTRNGRQARVVRGPNEWGNRTAIHVAGR